MILVDAHEDLAWNIQTFGRDYLRPVETTRARERDTETIARNGTTLLGWPEWIEGRVAVIFATLFATPASRRMGEWETNCYEDAEGAHRLYWSQLELYHRLVEAHADKLQLIERRADLEQVLATWEEDSAEPPRVGFVILMEGADGVREPAEVQRWYEGGVRLLGPAWTATRYAGGTQAPGPFTKAGRALLDEMASLGMVLDLSHLSEEGAREALERYEGPTMASHSNARALLAAGSRVPERHLSDEVIIGIAEREGVIGVVLGNSFLKGGWTPGDGRELVTLDDVAVQIDYMCQLIGDARHVGIGSDADGGFGLEKMPTGIDTVADLSRIGNALAARGYREEEIEAILGGNWLRFLRRTLPE
ncbi:MAG: dipeptidase [Ardenticatenaceae bacterium]